MVRFGRHKAEQYRKLMNKSADSLADEQAAYAPMLTEAWKPDTDYEAGKRLCYSEKLYKVLQAHTSQETWTPDTAVSLYAEVLIPDPSIIPEWVQPTSANPYMKGDKVRHNGKKWESAVDNNVWEPGAVGTETLWVEF
jgi:hypothetical protein